MSKRTSVKWNLSPIIVMGVDLFLFQGTTNIRRARAERWIKQQAHTGMISRVNWVG